MWLVLGALVALIVAGAAVPVRPSHALKRVFKEPVELQKGESIPYHPLGEVSDGDSFEDGMRAVGEWMQSMGLFTDEKEPVAPLPPRGESLELDLGLHSADVNAYRTLKRGETALNADPLTPSSTGLPALCSGRGILMNKTTIIVRILHSIQRTDACASPIEASNSANTAHLLFLASSPCRTSAMATAAKFVAYALFQCHYCLIHHAHC